MQIIVNIYIFISICKKIILSDICVSKHTCIWRGAQFRNHKTKHMYTYGNRKYTGNRAIFLYSKYSCVLRQTVGELNVEPSNIFSTYDLQIGYRDVGFRCLINCLLVCCCVQLGALMYT